MNKDEMIEPIVNELRSLARKKPLKGRNLTRVKGLMARLMSMSFTNEQISELTEGGWDESTVKLYTRGASVEDPSPKENAVKLLVQMVTMNLTLKDVKSSIVMKADCDAREIGFEDVSSLLEETKRLKVDVKELIQTHKDLKNSRLSVIQLGEVLSYKSELEKAGFTLDSLKNISEASKAHGGYTKVLQAINTYGSLTNIEAQVAKAAEEKGDLGSRVGELRTELGVLEGKKIAVEQALKIYDELRRIGFDEALLNQVKSGADKYGGVEAVLEAVNTYGKLSELKSQMNDLETRIEDGTSELNKVQADHAHLQTVITMCDTLLYKFRFSVPAITDIYETAKKYGEPLEVLKALGKHGELKAIEREVEKLSGEKGELQSRVTELEKQVLDLSGISKELKNSTKELLKPVFSELSGNVKAMGEAFPNAIQSIETTYQYTLTSLKSMYEEYANRLGELETEAGRFEEEMKLARIISIICSISLKYFEINKKLQTTADEPDRQQ